MSEQDMPAWMPELAERVRKVKLPTAQLADAMRDCGEDPRDEDLWRVRIDQLDTVLFGDADGLHEHFPDLFPRHE